jgi:hypothetical protein
VKQKIIATGAGIVLVSLAAVGAFASQDGMTFQELEATETSEATETLEPTETVEPTPTEEAEPTEEAVEADEPTDCSEGEDEEELDAAGEGEATDGDGCHGIPDSNPVFGPDDGDGECEKHETGTKTTPSGNVVNVPCHASDAEKDEHENSNKHDGDDEGEDEEEDEEESEE